MTKKLVSIKAFLNTEAIYIIISLDRTFILFAFAGAVFIDLRK